jgi:hypothetical protein
MNLLKSDLEKFQNIGMNACLGKLLDPPDIASMIQHRNPIIRAAGINACNGRPKYFELIKQAFDDDSPCVRLAAAKAAKYRELLPELQFALLNDKNAEVRKAATETYLQLEKNLPLIRDFKPPEIVFTKCLGGAIVLSMIPADAQVRGNPNHWCRTNKTSIVGIKGSFYGERVGISTFDSSIIYSLGDEIDIEDFDMGHLIDVRGDEYGKGFYFMTSLSKAMAWEYK